MTSSILHLFVGDGTEDLAHQAKRHNSLAYLISQQNIKNTHRGTAYVSLADIDKLEDFFSLLLTASQITFVEPSNKIWSDGKTKTDPYSMARLTDCYIRCAVGLKQISCDGITKDSIQNQLYGPKRKTTNQELWVAGCSTTCGTGIKIGQRYCDILSQTLGIPLNVIARPGSSNTWSADQILRADIAPGDIVVWGLTNFERFAWIYKDQLCHINTAFYGNNPEFDKVVSLDLLNSPQMLYASLCAIEQVDNFCKKANAKLVLAGIHANIELSACLADKPNYIMIHGTYGTDWDSDFLDYGEDNAHPGVLTHQMYADKILQKINELEYLK